MTAVTQVRQAHVEAFYSVLTQVDLGADAANIYWRPALFRRLFPPLWAKSLLRAYRAAPGRLVAHAVPLLVNDYADMVAWLRAPKGALADAHGRELCRWLLKACESEGQPELGEVLFTAEILELLEVLHCSLWDGQRRPQLEIRLCDALGNGAFTHGRAVTLPGRQVVAVSITPDPVFAALQVFHETTHAVSDPTVARTEERDTAAGSAGFEQHLRIERAAVELGQQLIEDHAPLWLGHYERWRARYGMGR